MTLSQSFSAFTPKIWSPRVYMFFKAKLAAAPFFQDYSSDVDAGGNTVAIPKVAASFSAGDVTTTGGVIASTNVNDTNTILTLNQWKAVAYDISDYQYAQLTKSWNVKNGYAQAMGYALAKTFDTALLANGSSVTPVVGDSSKYLLSTSLEKAFGILESNSVPKEDCVFFVHPKTYWNTIMAISKYYDASQFGKPSVPQGAHDMLYGVPVVITSQIPLGTDGTEGGYRNLLVHKSAIVYAMNMMPGADSTGIRLQEKETSDLKKRIIADINYGTAVLNALAGVRVISKD
jgi:hypothetical protein